MLRQFLTRLPSQLCPYTSLKLNYGTARALQAAEKTNTAATNASNDPQSQVSSDKSASLKPDTVFFNTKENVYVCWHPEVPFPYEMSVPIPVEPEATQSNLKVQALTPVRSLFTELCVFVFTGLLVCTYFFEQLHHSTISTPNSEVFGYRDCYCMNYEV